MNSEELFQIKQTEIQAQKRCKHRLLYCAGAGCLSSGATHVKEALETELKEKGLSDEVQLVPTGCMSACNQGPLLRIMPENTMYRQVPAVAASEIVSKHIVEGSVVDSLFCSQEAPFFQSQEAVVLENCGWINPERIEEYIAVGGYTALARAITQMTPEEVIGQVEQSGLRGRGGAGYPTGVKWNLVRKSPGTTKYIVCNGDEGDPGAFMDRSVLEGDPHRVLEAMAIAGYAIGAQQGYLYVRAEYPLAIQRLKTAIRQAERSKLLGNRILDTAFNFQVDIRVGAGAFVCGEETALIASIEGKRGTPRPRPPYPSDKGLWGKPTLINNVETFANITPIILKGADWFRQIGTPESPGTKVFALAGKIGNTGLIEVPMGISLREIVETLGGGIPDNRQFKAAQTGGPSGGCIPAAHLDTPIAYETLKKLGSIMGSGGLIVMDDRSCMVDVAKFFMAFCMDESCGKCIPCRVGTVQMHNVLDRITTGKGTLGDLEMLENLCPMVQETSLCGLGQTAPNPVLSTLRYFREEYLAHIIEKRCPAGVCQMSNEP